MDLSRIAAVLGVKDTDIARIAGDQVTLADGTVHTFADPLRFGFVDFERPAAKAAAAPKEG